MRPILKFGLILSIAACSDWPELDQPTSSVINRGAWPQLLPASKIIDRDLQQTVAAGTATDEDATRLAQRARNLQTRARILRLDASTLAEMEALRARVSVY